ncbi:MAG: precorrin-8X methylmutase [Lachnospiraceae bacterium]|nr:precorrin-8X methylmutase [Lachnospiraceae bacterium]
MNNIFSSPAEIEKESMRIIGEGLQKRNLVIPEENLDVVMRTIHTTADFDYADSLYFTKDACSRIINELTFGTAIITDTNMALSGISKKALAKLGPEAFCFMADPSIEELSKKNGTTRAYEAFGYASSRFEKAAFVSGNAPTALIRLCELMEEGYRPVFIIGVPVGFVNVVESKEEIIKACEKYNIPAIVARGNKGGSNVAAGIMNALLYRISRKES